MDQKTRYALLAVTAVVVVGGAWAIWGNNTEEMTSDNNNQATTTATSTKQATTTTTPKNTTTGSGTVTQPKSPEISYGPSGFSPNALTIKKGTTVKFVNRSGALRLQAVNPNTQEVYASFGTSKTLSTGQSYTYVFNDKGIAYFHNLLNKEHTGTIVVTD